MTSTAGFLTQLQRLDVRLERQGESLRINAPKGALNSELRAELSRRKAEILGFLGAEANRAPHPVKRQAQMPLSLGQRSLWFLHQLEPDQPTYNIFDGLRIRGELDVSALARSLVEIEKRHEALRSSFLAVDDEPWLRISPTAAGSLVLVDASGLASEARAQVLAKCNRSEARRPFDLEKGPLLRALLVKISDREHVLFLTLHHIIADAWSMVILMRDLLEGYSAAVEQRCPDLPVLPIQYVDYADWQRRTLTPQVIAQQIEFWQKRLDDAPILLELPSDRPRPAAQSFRGALLPVHFTPRIHPGLTDLTRRLGMTPFVVVTAALSALLYLLTGQKTILIGSAIAGRNRRETEALIGFFVNMVVLRLDFPGSALTWRELLQQSRATVIGATSHQDLPFERVVEEVKPSRSLSYSPIFQVALVMQDMAAPHWQTTGLELQPVAGHTRTTKGDLTLLMRQGQGGMAGSFEYNTDLFDATTLQRWGKNLNGLLEALVDDPDALISWTQALTASERQQINVEWSHSPQGGWMSDDPTAPETTITELFRQTASEFPDRPAVLFGSQHLSYGELDLRSELLARRLKALSIGSEDRVALLAERSVEMVTGVWGILKAGAAYVPVDPGYPEERRSSLLQHADVSTVLVTRRTATSEADLGAKDGSTKRHALLIEAAGEPMPDQTISKTGLDRALLDGRADDPAYVIFTSGSTGGPKGVVVAHRQLVRSTRARRRIYPEPPERFLLMSSIAFDSSVAGFFWTLTEGGLLVLPLEGVRRDLDRLTAILHEARITHMLSLPAIYSLLLEFGEARKLGLQTVIVAGEACPGDLVSRHQELRPRSLLFNEYGPTEGTVWSTVENLGTLGERGTAVSIGFPIPGVTVRLLDPDGQTVGMGVAGEMYLGGDGLARGYLGHPALTAERFGPDPFSTRGGDRLYRTGDLARFRAAGYIEFLGRHDHQVKIRGFRIEPAEIEDALLAQEGVREAIVLVWPLAAAEATDRTTPRSKKLVAYVAPRSGVELDPRQLGRQLQTLPNYMVPSAFVIVAALPRTPNGKVDRGQLPKPEFGQGGRMASGRIESILSRVWAEVLGLETVGVEDNFFTLGGDSILSIQVIARATREGLAITPQDLFRYQTIAELAALLERQDETKTKQVLGTEPISGPVLLTPIQQWFFRQPMANWNHWNQAILLNLEPQLDPRLCAAALTLLRQRHDMLRARFERTTSGWRQEVLPDLSNAADSVLHLDLTALDKVTTEAARSVCAGQLQGSLDLTTGSILRAAHFQLRERAQLLLIVHHLVVDGVSWRILLEDFHMLLSQLRGGAPPLLPHRTTSYQAWSEHLKRQPELRREAKDRWPTPSEPLLKLPRDSQGLNSVASAEQVAISFSPAETEKLLRRVPVAANAALADILLSAVLEVLMPWCGDGLLAVQLEGHGRVSDEETLDLSRTVGWFTALYPEVFRSSVQASRLKILQQVKERSRSLPQGGIGYGVLRELGSELGSEFRSELDAEKDWAGWDEPEVLFNHLGQFTDAGRDTLFKMTRDDVGPSRTGERSQVLEINSSIFAGQLEIELTYSSSLHHRETVEGLAAALRTALYGWIEAAATENLATYTPADFPAAALDQATLDQLIAGRTGIADIYPLSPLQEGILFHVLYDPEAGEYLMQFSCELAGDIDPDDFRQAWQRALDRHDILRTAFFWEGLDAPLQVVHHDLTLPWEERDLRDYADPKSEIDRFIAADYQRGFDLKMAPLLRLTLLRTGEQTYHFVWTTHHLLLDGWSLPLLLDEVFSALDPSRRERRPSDEDIWPYRDYIAWLAQQDTAAAQEYWQKTLTDFTESTPLVFGRKTRDLPPGEADYQILDLRLSAEESAELRAFARRHQLTLGTVLEGAWALLLRHLSRRDDVVFGVAVSGRPADLPGVDKILGLLLNTLPVRVLLKHEEPFIRWLATLQYHQAEARRYESTPLPRIQEWSEIKAPAPLFESFLTFQNYPVEDALRRLDFSFQMRQIKWKERANFPLTFVIAPDAELRLECQYSRRRFDPRTITQVLEDFSAVLREIVAADPETRLRDLEKRLEEVTSERQQTRRASFQKTRSQLLAKARKKRSRTGAP